MSDQIDTDSNFIDLDLEQWRREIDTFAAATTSALDAITGELSTVCSGGQVSSIAKSAPAQLSEKGTTVLPRSTHEPGAVRPAIDKNTTPTSSGGRLASLKEKLASRINNV